MMHVSIVAPCDALNPQISSAKIGYLDAWEGVALDVRGVTFHGPKLASIAKLGSEGLFSVGQYGGPNSRPSSINPDLLSVNEWRPAD